ncbi:hypothetical protein CMT41_14710 [Colwellia sp. MT41]|uniref:hypothetical protein n=1 Tax=Colwellia sp. MT41 TaxID=58049 RepID=UPI00071778C0|nr:hypothetical protein [Colwellia sp. MT41]ALO35832.1 hypothetical protein CMT41_14710 [Colwellia sp. MT41]
MMNSNNLKVQILSTFITSKAVKYSTGSPRWIRPYLSMGLIILLASLASACQMPPPATKTNDGVNYSQYYLWLKTLNKQEVLTEEQKQHVLINQPLKGVNFSQGKLILIYSLANTPLHQPYKAKRLLNEHLLASNNMSKENVAFTMLLRDQLNTQLYLLEKQARSSKKFSQQSDEHHAEIKQLNNQLNHVNQQLMLLKQIEQNINERG